MNLVVYHCFMMQILYNAVSVGIVLGDNMVEAHSSIGLSTALYVCK